MGGNKSERDTAASGYPEINYSSGAKWIKNLTQDRLSQFTGGNYSDINLSSVLFHHRLDDSEHVKLEVWSAPGKTKPSFEEAMKQKFRPARKGEWFGPSWTNHWWKVSVAIPSSWSEYEQVQFEFDPSCEAMIFTTDGTPLQGITGGYDGDRRVDYIIPHSARSRGSLDFVIESSCNGMFGISGIAAPDPNRYFALASADLVVPNQEAWRLLWDFTTIREIINDLPGNSILQNKAVYIANKIMNTFVASDPSTIGACRKLAEEIFGEGWEAKKEGIYNEGVPKTGRVQVWGIGNCHIDTAWLWPYSVTQQKAARSWATQLDLMDRYPEHRFATSQAQQFKWVEQLYPKLFDRIKEKVKTGQFQVVGGSWVENDANMPSGEALARQMIYGQRYFQSRFGVRSQTAWLPDSFGLSGALPQLIRGCGMTNFFTQKLSWNNINVFPHSTFNWVGIDGTQVLCHMTPVDTYTAQATTADVRRGIWNHKNLESGDTALLAFGNGDGGGGPLNKMLENLRRIRAVANENREVPIVTMGPSVDEFYDDIHKTTDEGAKLPVWHGELYLEFHRGTYTSHASIKKGNRHSEVLLRVTEFASTLASLYRSKKFAYPKQRIDDSWEKILLNQFHDVLPGSAIGMVYDDAEKLYAEVAAECRTILHEAFSALLPGSKPLESSLDIPRTSGSLVTINATPFARCELLPVPAALTKDVVQIAKDGVNGYALVNTPGFGTGSSVGMFAETGTVRAEMIKEGEYVLRNSNIEIKFVGGRIVSLFDIVLERQLIPPGQSGGLVIFERDQPNYWDAWDVEIHHLETSRPLHFTNLRIKEHGPMRASLEGDIDYGQSKIGVTITLDAVTATTAANSRSYVRFDAQVDWRERHKFLKFEIPLNIHSDTAYFESAFGHVSRPTHKNTKQDQAKFEVCGHRYADLSEYGYGVAILSESKYGWAASGNTLRLSLLRAATSPDPEQDQGVHTFSWAVLAHKGHFFESDVVQAAYVFNTPLQARFIPKGVYTSPFVSPFSVEGAPNVILDTVKRGDDDTYSFSGTDAPSVVLRLYEAYGGHAVAKLRISDDLQVSQALSTNLLEEEIETLHIARSRSSGDSYITLSFRGFEVKTIKLILHGAKQNQDQTRISAEWVTVGE